jgi:hypothetical protein
MAVQTREQGRYLGGRPPYGYRLADAGPHPNKAHAAWGRRAHRLDPDPATAPTVRWIFAQRLAGSRSRDTGRMPVNDIEGARAALHAGRVADLLGLAECGWLDVKAGVYQLDDPAKSLELAKDVSAFANAKSGGVILVGYATRKEHGEEFLAEVRPVPRALVDLDRYRKVIRELVIPVPREFTVDFIRVDDGSGILVIDVPVQPVALVPFVVPGPAGAAGSSRVSVAVPFREADATVWLPQTEIQQHLIAGQALAEGIGRGH